MRCLLLSRDRTRPNAHSRSGASCTLRTIALFAGMTLVAGCASAAPYRANKEQAPRAVTRKVMPCESEGGFECDRRAILAMAGNYKVTFHFEETVPLAADYTPRAEKDVSAREAVVVVSDMPHRIELQHLLVVPGGQVVKHWRQVWEYESPRHFVFVGDQRFEPRTRSEAERQGTWTQLVYEVNDAPRYAGLGRWVHRGGISTWTSEQTWRPLPRREYTTRDDYDLLSAVNRHTITPSGWTHEQDNTKVVRRGGRGDRPLVREFGFNEYTLIDDPLEPAHAYWRETAPYWAEVRARWNAKLSQGPLQLSYPVNEEKKLVEVLEQAEAFRKTGDLAAARAYLDGMIAAVVSQPPSRSKVSER